MRPEIPAPPPALDRLFAEAVSEESPWLIVIVILTLFAVPLLVVAYIKFLRWLQEWLD